MDIADAVKILRDQVQNPSKGLPDEVFYYISEVTPLINVDLLIKDEKGRTLLSWRDDPYCGKGWHIPGGIVRFKETFEERVKKVAEAEIGADIDFEKDPILIKQCILPKRNVRGHFISILYKCFLPSTFHPENKESSPHTAGDLKWHDSCPEDLIRYHDMYRQYINER